MITLSEAINKNCPNYKEMLDDKNLLIVSPCGSGKTYWIFNYLFTDSTKKYLYLCDTSNLKRMVMKNPNVWDSNNKILNDKGEIISIRGFGRENYARNIIAMTYSEFDKRLKWLGTDESYQTTEEQLSFIQEYDIIICDEAHNLINFSKFTKDVMYYYAIDKLKNKYDKTKIIWLTATPQSIYRYQEELEKRYIKYVQHWNTLCQEGVYNNFINPFPKKSTPILQNFKIIEFTPEKDNIKHYLNKRLDYIRDYKDIPNELRKYKEYFKYSNGKVLIYVSEIEYMKITKDLLNEIDFLKPIAIWSVNNHTKTMTQEQLNVIKYIIDTEHFPNEYNCVIINDAMLTGINIEDKDVKIMVVVSSDDSTIIQSRGRVRQDLDLLVVRACNSIELSKIKLLEGIDIDEALAEYTSKEATKEELEQLILKYNLRDKNNTRRQLSVNKFLKELELLGYIVESKRIKIEDRKRTVYIIKK